MVTERPALSQIEHHCRHHIRDRFWPVPVLAPLTLTVH
jgi:hypothetical protein